VHSAQEYLGRHSETAAPDGATGAGASPAVEAIGVCKRYREREALRGVDLVVMPGQLHGLLGPNGAGKTTLMRILLGLTRSDRGTVRVLGAAPSPTGGSLPDGVAGFVETPAFYPYLSGRRNLALCARLDHCEGDRSARVAHALERVGLSSAADSRVSGFSTGMRQRLGVAAALLRSPRLLVLDEPTTALDPAAAHSVRDLARGLAGEGAAIVWSSHDMSEVEDLCAHVTVIDAGRVIYTGAVEELRRRAPAAVHLLQTSDDRIAAAIASQRPGVKVRVAAVGEGLEVAADEASLDAYVIALGQTGVAIRLLEHRTRSLESLFLELTSPHGSPHAVHVAPAACAGPAIDAPSAAAMS
jgi:ABC-2 type transport system ATP-binding protein